MCPGLLWKTDSVTRVRLSVYTRGIGGSPRHWGQPQPSEATPSWAPSPWLQPLCHMFHDFWYVYEVPSLNGYMEKIRSVFLLQVGGTRAPHLCSDAHLYEKPHFPLPSPKASFDLTKFATPDLNRASQTRGLGLKTWSTPKESHKFQGLSIKFPTPDSDRASHAQGLWILC